MTVWSFIQTMCQDNDLVPMEYRLSVADHARLLTYSEDKRNSILKQVIVRRELEIYTRSEQRQIRYCRKCRIIKPDRAHHCSTCNTCVLKMDHHCPWVNNCIGYVNYKQFILLLLYGTVYCVFCVSTLLEYAIQFWDDAHPDINRVQIALGLIISFLMGLLLLSLFIYHVTLICKNETTLESIQDLVFENGLVTFDSGMWYNFIDIFGDNCCLWMIPIQSSLGNGYIFNVSRIN